ncbi:MAG: AAA family ATPase [Gammaproteobacteria bacterium]|nr:AAA family ATPase [Gammaproteobacteria bacterium]
MSKEESLPVSDIAPRKIRDKIEEAVSEISNVILGKEKQIRLSLCCLFAGGHLLMEDKPGMGKTTLSQALANAFGLNYSRIQFTSDLLPADILGVTIYDQSNGEFSFHQGPIFSNLVLADEINRTTPKTQSALLEAMEEGQVSIDNKTMVLPRPFFVIATQNPVSFAGTYPLPESQLDRFLMRLQIGYPDPAAERELLNNRDQREKIAGMKQSLNAEDVIQISNQIPEVHTTDTLLDYVQRIVAYTRQDNLFSFGLSPRGAMALTRSARTWALMHDRMHVIPEDVQMVLPAVVDHRLRAISDASGRSSESYYQRLLNEVDIFSE